MNRFRCLLAAFGIAMAMGAGVAQASYTLYDNTATFSGNVYAGGGASGIGTVSTAMFADDITVASNPTGYAVNSISFSLGNLNSTSASAAPTIYIYAADPSTFGPGSDHARVRYGNGLHLHLDLDALHRAGVGPAGWVDRAVLGGHLVQQRRDHHNGGPIE
jgi:hypothetical protein